MVEAGAPVAFDDLGTAIGEHPTAGGAAGDGVEAFFEVYAAGLGKDEGFAHGEAVADDEDLVDELDGLAGALFADVGNGLAHGFEDAVGAFDLVFVAADHDAEGTVGGAFAAAADGGVEHFDAFGVELGGDVDGCLGADGAAVDDQPAIFGPGEDAIFAEDNGLDIGGCH